MMGWMLLIGYVLSALWTLRFIGGAIYQEERYIHSRPDWGAAGLGTFIGFIIGILFGPFVVAGRVAYVLWNKFVPDDTGAGFLDTLLPGPKEVKPIGAKKKAKKEAEAREAGRAQGGRY